MDLKISTQLKARIRNIDWLFWGSAAAAAIVSLSPVLRHTGWPLNHDFANSMHRVEVYAAHFRRGDVFPIWSASDGYGLGSALPLYYQKLFYYITATVFVIIGGHVKACILLGLFTFFMVGAYGMKRCVALLSSSRLLTYSAPIAFIFTNYTYTNWLVRGDMAEFSAAMLIPWITWWCLKLLRDKEIHYSLIIIMLALFFAHNAIAMLATAMIGVALVMHVSSDRKNLRVTVYRLLVSACAGAVVLAPLFLIQLEFSRFYDPSVKITESGYTPDGHFLPWTHYFYDPNYHWLHNWSTLTPQIDFGITFGVIGLVILPVIYALAGQKKRSLLNQKLQFSIFLSTCFVLYLFLQFPISRVAYDAIKPLQLIQFPWRMLSLITPLGLLLCVLFFDFNFMRRRRSRTATAAVGLWLGSFILLSPVFAGFHYPFMSPSRYDAPQSDMLYHENLFLEAGEYLPKTYWPNGQEYDLYKMNVTYAYLYRSRNLVNYTQADAGCSYKQAYTPFESPSLRYRFYCQSTTGVLLPVSYSDYLRVYSLGKDGLEKPLSYGKIKTDSRTLVTIHGGQPLTVRIVLPTWTHVLVAPLLAKVGL